MTSATRDQILSSIWATDRYALRLFMQEGTVPRLTTLVKLIRLGLIQKTRDGYAAAPEDRLHPLEVTYEDGRRIVSGSRIGKLPTPSFFGVRTDSFKVINFGKLMVNGTSMRRACRIAGIDYLSGVKILKESGLPNVYQQRKQEQRNERNLRAVTLWERRKERLQEREALRLARGPIVPRPRRTEAEKLAKEAANIELRQQRELIQQAREISLAECRIRQSERAEERRLMLKSKRKYWSELAPLEAGSDEITLPVPDGRELNSFKTTVRLLLGQYTETKQFRWSVRSSVDGKVRVTRNGAWVSRVEL